MRPLKTHVSGPSLPSPDAEDYEKGSQTRFWLSEEALAQLERVPGSDRSDRLRALALLGVGRPCSTFAGIISALNVTIAGKNPQNRAWNALEAEWRCTWQLLLAREIGLPARSRLQMPANSGPPSGSLVINVRTLQRISNSAGVRWEDLGACVERGARNSKTIVQAFQAAISAVQNSTPSFPPSEELVRTLRSLMSQLETNR